MPKSPLDKQVDIVAGFDRGEGTHLMEPLLIGETSRHRHELTDLALELASQSSGLKHSLPESIVAALADLVRAMNCYYSNLIEGHDTHPVDIERALKGDYSADAKKRDLQLEAKAHMTVQKWIDQGGLRARPVQVASIRDIHSRFCGLLPPDLLWLEDPASKERIEVIPGEFRQRDVVVGHHVAISAPAVPRFMARYEAVYAKLGKTETLIAAAAAHHRLAWIHPFLDGNGRVARLVSHATMLEALDSGAIWSVARGLARNVEAYKGHLANCDLPRRNDLDGRGILSEEALVEFTRFFLTTCLDQVRFMQGLMQPRQLRTRIMMWAEEEIRLNRMLPQSNAVLDAVLYRGELPRKDVAAIVGTGDRQARRVIAALVDLGVLTAESTRADLRLAFPAALASRWMPGLFPELGSC